MPLLEIAATSVEDAANAARGGADSIEISRDLSVGGLTPDAALVADVIRELRGQRVAIHVMVRPHARGFICDGDDVAQILESVRELKILGVSGLVFGACERSGRLDFDLIDRIRREAAPLTLTVHRALDLSVEPERALEQLAAMGITRVLTAGPALNAWDGRFDLGRWVARFAVQMEFVVSGGLTMEQIAEMRAVTRAQVFHFGSAARADGVVDVAKVRELRARGAG